MKTLIYKLHGETELPKEFINVVPSSGRADEATAQLAKDYDIQVSDSDLYKYLKGVGIDDLELKDRATQIQYLIWISALDCKEQKTTYFYMGY